jgi:hypothetical protein
MRHCGAAMLSNPEPLAQPLPHAVQPRLASVTGPAVRSPPAATVERTLGRRLVALGGALRQRCWVTRPAEGPLPMGRAGPRMSSARRRTLRAVATGASRGRTARPLARRGVAPWLRSCACRSGAREDHIGRCKAQEGLRFLPHGGPARMRGSSQP